MQADWEYWENEVQPLLEGKQVELLGQLAGKDKDDLLRNAAALLFPIRWPEPFGLVMVEALACGTPVLALRAGQRAGGRQGRRDGLRPRHRGRAGGRRVKRIAELDRGALPGRGRAALLARGHDRCVRAGLRTRSCRRTRRGSTRRMTSGTILAALQAWGSVTALRSAVIFDVDGVLVASPHERAWRDALAGADGRRLARHCARHDVRARTLHHRGLPGSMSPANRVWTAPRPCSSISACRMPRNARSRYGERKQAHDRRSSSSAASSRRFQTRLRLVLALHARGVALGVASSSKNANQFMERVPLDRRGETLRDIFDANVCGRDVAAR